MKKDKKDIIKKAKKVKLLASDVDGVLTRGEIIIFNDGEEIKVWNVKDGMGYGILSRISPKIKTAWITGRKSLQVERRAKDMNINYLVQSCMSKKEALEKILMENSFKASETAYIGDDIVDIPILKVVGLSLCPADACEEVKQCVDYVSIFKGGEGVVRDVIELVMKAKNDWKKSLETYK
ncbi:MAG: HAD hydrolase family protein [Endomicrobium sp.]|nr:HAD hydrolase family protein [Endomicrobium sp.]